MELIKAKTEFVAIRNFFYTDPHTGFQVEVKIGTVLEIENKEVAAELFFNGRVNPQDTPAKGEYKILHPNVSCEKDNKITLFKVGEIVSIAKSEAINLMRQRKVRPTNYRQWAP